MQLKVDIELSKCDRYMKDRILPYIDTPIGSTQVRAFKNPGEPIRPADFFAQLRRGEVPFEPLALGENWGTSWGTTWMEVTGQIDPDKVDAYPIEMIVDLGWNPDAPGGHFEALAYREDGSIIKAINPRNVWIPIDGRQFDGSPTSEEPSIIRPDGSFTFYLEGACNPLILGPRGFAPTHLGDGPTGQPDDANPLNRMDVCHLNAELWNYYLDLDVVSSLIRELDQKKSRYWKLAKALQRSLNLYDERDLPGTLAAARAALAPVLAAPAVPSTLHFGAVGHSHIDSSWLWPKRETERKVVRTVSNMLALLERDPNFTYAMSAAQHFDWLEKNEPALFARLAARVKEGRIIPVGGMWVESDGMVPNGESLIRQITVGKNYFRSRFGVDPDGIWLPDSFGYTGAWPQIARRAGMTWFLTQKISWNDTTKFPHHSFDWEGVDGTRIFTHFPPADTYGALLTSREMNYAEENFKDKDMADKAIMLFGYGDGGGGPVREMLGRFDRFKNLEGLPTLEYQDPSLFYAEASKQLHENAGAEMPVWKGELYLELHRKTLTSQQDMKKGCRQEESLLRTVEYLGTVASLANRDYTYPAQELDGIWKTLLLNQFHDILPGSALSWTHREAREDYRRDLARLRELAAEASKAIEQASGAISVNDARLIPLPASGSTTVSAWQAVAASASPQDAPAPSLERSDGSYVLDNGAIKATVSAVGEVVSVIDTKSGRELIPAGSTAGTYELLTDKPFMWDAWDLERDAFLTAKKVDDPATVEVLDPADNGGAAGLRVTRRHGKTTIVTTISLAAGKRQLDFAAYVDWQEEEKLLKVDMPVAIQARYAQYETQYGFIERPIAKNDAAEEAKFESCTHRFVRVQDNGLAVGVVNASTYGSDLAPIADGNERSVGTMVRLTLLSAPKFPDTDTDRGEHDFAWSLVPAEEPTDILAAAYELNSPVLDEIAAVEAPVSLEVTSGQAVIDWVKPADDGSGDVIVRVFEPAGTPARAVLHAGSLLRGAQVKETGLMEDAPTPEGLRTALVDGAGAGQQVALEGAQLDLAPFQLATLRIQRD